MTKNLPEKPPLVSEFISKYENYNEYVKALQPTITCMVNLVQIATKGKVEDCEEFTNNPSQFLSILMTDERRGIQDYLKARALFEVMSRPSSKDPLDWMQLLSMIEDKEFKRELEQKRFQLEQDTQPLKGLVDAGDRRFKSKVVKE